MAMTMHNPAHPGEILREYLGAVQVGEAAERLRVARSTLSRLLNGRASFTAAMALRLADAFGNEVPHRVSQRRDCAAMAREIHAITTRPWKIMEVCGGQTHSIIKNGIDQMLPAGRRDDSRPRLPGLRHAARTDRQGAGHRRAARRDLLLVRRHAARSRHRGRPFQIKARAAMCAWSIRRWMRLSWPPRIPTSRWSSSAWVLRPRLRPTP
jgi:addiction module HigA family antidote